MPRFFFNVHDDAQYPDLEGTQLANLNAARDEAVRLAATVLRRRPDQFWSAKKWSMEVCDDFGLLLFALAFSAAEMPSCKAVPYASDRGAPAANGP